MGCVLLLRDSTEARDLSFLLEDEGHQPAFLPVLAPPIDVSPSVRAAAETLQRFTWVIALHRGAVLSLLAALQQAGTRSLISRVQWLTPDLVTARMIERAGGIARIPGEGKWTSALSGFVTAEDEVLVMSEGPCVPVVLESLEAAGARVVVIELERSTAARASEAPAEPVEVVLVHSAAAADAWAELTRGPDHPRSESCCGGHVHVEPPLKQLAALRVVAASPLVAEALRDSGVQVWATSVSTSADALAEAAIAALPERDARAQ